MSNDVTGWPWVIDTAGASELVSSSWTPRLIRWVAPAAAAGNQAVVTDKKGRAIWEAVASAVNFQSADLFDEAAPVDGLKVPTLAAGKLYIYYTTRTRVVVP